MLHKTAKRAVRVRRIRTRIKQDRGSGTKPRLIVFRSLKYIYGQLVDDTTHEVILSASDLAMEKVKGTKTERATLVGTKLAELAKEKGITSCVFDRSGFRYHGRVRALADGVRAGGIIL